MPQQGLGGEATEGVLHEPHGHCSSLHRCSLPLLAGGGIYLLLCRCYGDGRDWKVGLSRAHVTLNLLWQQQPAPDPEPPQLLHN